MNTIKFQLIKRSWSINFDTSAHDDYDSLSWFTKFNNVPLPSLERDEEEVKQGTRIKI